MRETKLGLLALVVACVELVSEVAGAADQRFRLSNGLQVILQPDTSRPRVAASVSYRVGQRDDPDGFGDLAHFVEHMMFEGSLRVDAGEHMAWLERVGATRANGATRLDRTTFSSEVPQHAWRLPLWLESERMAFLLSRIDAAAVDKERNIILNEGYERGQHLAWGTRWLEASQGLFPQGHPYRLDRGYAVGGIGLEDVQVFFQKYYGPNQATLALVGAFEATEARATIERYFGGIHNSFEAPQTAPVKYTPLSEAKSIVRHAAVRSESVAIVWPVPPRFTKAAPRFAVLAEYLRHLPALLRSLREAEVSEVLIKFDANELASVFWVELLMREDGRTDEVPSAVIRQFERLATEGLDHTNLAFARQRLVAGWASLADDFSERADFLSQHGRSIESEALRYSKVQPDEVTAALGWLSRAHPLIMTTHFDPRVLFGGAYSE